MALRDVQSWNTAYGREVIVFGSEIYFNPLALKAHEPIDCKPVPNAILSRAKQFSKALSPTNVTEFGIVMDSRAVQL